MKRNSILSSAMILTRIVQVIIIAFITLFVVVFIHWHVNPLAYENVDLRSGFQAGFGVNGIKINGNGTESLPMSIVSRGMFYWLFIRTLIFFIIILLITDRIRRILHSVRKLNTFYTENIHHFRTMGLLGIVAFAISSINFYNTGEITSISLTFAFAPLFFAIGCYVLAEIFYEGKLLQEDKDQII